MKNTAVRILVIVLVTLAVSLAIYFALNNTSLTPGGDAPDPRALQGTGAFPVAGPGEFRGGMRGRGEGGELDQSFSLLGLARNLGFFFLAALLIAGAQKITARIKAKRRSRVAVG
jgi:hypothetical protein